MAINAFSFMTSVVTKLENSETDRRTCDEAAGRVIRNTRVKLTLCRAAVRSGDRCFCNRPLMRSFGLHGRLGLSSLFCVAREEVDMLRLTRRLLPYRSSCRERSTVPIMLFKEDVRKLT